MPTWEVPENFWWEWERNRKKVELVCVFMHEPQTMQL